MLLDCCTGEAGGSLETGGSALELRSAASAGFMALGSHQQSHEVQGGEVPGAGGFSHEHFCWSLYSTWPRAPTPAPVVGLSQGSGLQLVQPVGKQSLQNPSGVLEHPDGQNHYCSLALFLFKSMTD